MHASRLVNIVAFTALVQWNNLYNNRFFNAYSMECLSLTLCFIDTDGHHRTKEFLVFTDSSNELFRISSIEIEVSIVMQLKIEVKSIGNERETKNKKHGSHQE